MRLNLKLNTDLPDFAEKTMLAIATGARNAAVRIATRAKLKLRDDIRQAGLGDRLANTWQSKVYPESGGAVLNPAALVYSKAPIIVSAFAEGATIVAKNARWLAIPTENVPMINRHRMTPQEVEIQFNQDLVIVFKGAVALAFVDVIAARRGHGFRPVTKGRTRQGRKPQLVLMFILVRQVHLRKRLDWPAIVAELEAEWPDVMAEDIAAALNQ